MQQIWYFEENCIWREFKVYCIWEKLIERENWICSRSVFEVEEVEEFIGVEVEKFINVWRWIIISIEVEEVVVATIFWRLYKGKKVWKIREKE